MEKLFKLKENGTSVKTEIIAGLTTFMTMAYIIALNPNLLTGWRAGGDDLWNAVFLATCLASGIAMICMAFLANKPFSWLPRLLRLPVRVMLRRTRLLWLSCWPKVSCS